MSSEKYYGKYRGTVVQNVDPLGLGRVQVVVPSVGGGGATPWATACVPLAGSSMGTYLVPPVGATVWVEFEEGSPDYPIWTGCTWASPADVPAAARAGDPLTPSIVIQSRMQHSIVLSDAPGPAGGIMLRSSSGAMILVNDTGITISNGQGATIELTGPDVSVNGEVLEVP